MLGRLPWSAKVKPRPDETWEEGAHGALSFTLWYLWLVGKRLGSLWDTVGHPFTIGWRHLNLEERCVCLPPCMAQDWNINHVSNSGFEHLESMKLFLAAVSL